MEYNKSKIFVEKSYSNVAKKLFPDSFKKNKIEFISALIVEGFIQFFIACSFEDYQNTVKPTCRPLTFNLFEA